jgi:Tat protein secretion system quality control protein TatD with DNase activity
MLDEGTRNNLTGGLFAFIVLKNMFFDTHTHASYAPLDTDEEGVFRRISESGVRHTLQIGCDVMSSKKAIDLALRHP